MQTEGEAMEARIMAGLERLEVRLDALQKQFEAKTGAVESLLTRTEATIFNGFRNWSRTMEMRVEGIPQLDARLAALEARVTALEIKRMS